ncbi:hypothetical protein GCM10010964_36070 [Caldovatus sediminis]|uniref:Uncharacterized protein n=1 Tax=Caldovatus sediminis TaxID=2041189 RepID=A0A8J3EET8_9PROT|nr:hypothetical protein GCM10010964_36070 [Caldovatus sediminis]
MSRRETAATQAPETRARAVRSTGATTPRRSGDRPDRGADVPIAAQIGGAAEGSAPFRLRASG